MKTLLLLLCPVLLAHLEAVVGISHNQSYSRSIGKTNIACELSYYVEALFKNSALVFYTQILSNASLADITRLVAKLSVFSSNCCLHDAGEECFQEKSSLFLDRVCDDKVLQLNNQDVSVCCDRTYGRQRKICFEKLRHRQSAQLPSIYDSHHLQGKCLSYMADTTGFVELLLYDISRRMRLFPPETIAKIARVSLKRYNTCCKEFNLTECFGNMEKQTVDAITTIIEEANKICSEFQNIGAGKTKLWGIMFFASLHPKGLIATALDFAVTYEKFAAKCCEFSEWTSDCFLEESVVLVNMFCEKINTTAHGDCCLQRGPERVRCLNQISTQESEGIPETIPIQTEKLCEIYKVRSSSLVVWFTFEYAKRH